MLAFNIRIIKLQWVVYATLLSQFCLSQVPVGDSQAKDILRASDTEQAEFVRLVLDKHFPENDGDRFSLLLVNKSWLVVPMLEAKLEEELKRSPPSERFVELASAMIAYSGDDEALRAVSKLIAIDEQKFGTLVGRTLDNALNWHNSFTLAYSGLQIGDEAISKRIVEWSESALSSDRMRRLWGDAIEERYVQIPAEGEWRNDPLASRMTASKSASLRGVVLGYATESRSKR